MAQGCQQCERMLLLKFLLPVASPAQSECSVVMKVDVIVCTLCMGLCDRAITACMSRVKHAHVAARRAQACHVNGLVCCPHPHVTSPYYKCYRANNPRDAGSSPWC
jgi:hypothetical protein